MSPGSPALIFITIKLNISENELNLLIDSASSTNLLKLESITEKNLIITDIKNEITGINANSYLETCGIINGNYTNKRSSLSFTFDVVNENEINLPINIDGILGIISLQKAEILLNQNKLKINNILFTLNSYSEINPSKNKLDFNSQKDRLKSMSYWDNHSVDKNLTSMLGFFYTGTLDLVKCHFCNLELDLYEDNSDVFEDHKRLSPNCKLFKGNSTNIPTNPKILKNYLSKDCLKKNLLKTSQTKAVLYNKNLKIIRSERMEKLNALINLSHLKTDKTELFLNLFEEFNDVFFLENDDLPGCNVLSHHIRLKNDTPTYVKQFPIPLHLRKEMNEIIERMLSQDIIEESYNSQYNSPFFLVKKKAINGKISYRAVTDYKKLNNQINPDRYPVPKIDECLSTLKNNSIFTSLDLYSSYHQIILHENSRHLTNFTVLGRTFQYRRTPMGLSDSGATLMRIFHRLFQDLDGVISYCDDLLIVSKTYEEHVNLLKEVFRRLRHSCLKLEPKKCSFATDKTEFLGFEISKQGIKIRDTKIESIINYSRPKTQRDVRAFLGLCSYFRKFVPKFADITHPLNLLLRKNIKFDWNEECSAAFEELKKKLTTPPILAHPNFDLPFIIQSDASNYAIGSVLMQKNSENNHVVIGYHSQSLTTYQKNWTVYERELFALTIAITKIWDRFIQGREVIACVDHLPLLNLMSERFDSGPAKVQRLRLALAGFNFKLVYIKGKKNNLSDFLSRIQDDNSTKAFIITDETDKDKICSEKIKVLITTRKQTFLKSIDQMDQSFKEFLDHKQSALQIQEKNSELNMLEQSFKIILTAANDDKIFSQYKNNFKIILPVQCPSIFQDEDTFLVVYKLNCSKTTSERELYHAIKTLEKRVDKTLQVINVLIPKYETERLIFHRIFGYLFQSYIVNFYLGERREIKENCERIKIIKMFHESKLHGHMGITKTFKLISEVYSWPKMLIEIINYIKTCEICQLNKKNTRFHPVPLCLTTTADKTFQIVSIDIVGRVNISSKGNSYILTILDNLSRYLICCPLKSQTAEEIAENLISKLFCVFGAPEYMLSDRAQNFLSDIMKETCKLFKVKKIFTTPHHPEASFVERNHLDLAFYLRSFTNKQKDNWDDLLPLYCLTYNNRIHLATKHSPHSIVFGKTCVLPFNNIRAIPMSENYNDFVHCLKNNLSALAQIAKENQEMAKITRKEIYDKRANTKVQTYQPGDQIKMKKFQKLGKKLEETFLGPFTVNEDIDDYNIIILVNGKPKRVHKNNVLPYLKKKDNK